MNTGISEVMIKQNELFEILKTQKSVFRKKDSSVELFFMLKFDEKGAYLEFVDDKGNIIEPEYEFYSGVVRDIVKAIRGIKEKNYFKIDWENSEERIYLHENEYLIWKLKSCKNVINSTFKSLSFAKKQAWLGIQIEDDAKEEDVLNSKLEVVYGSKKLKNIQFINENHICAGRKIYEIAPLSENFNNLSVFESTFRRNSFEKYLSLLFSGFREIPLKYKDYTVVKGDDKISKPALVFEKVDTENYLYLKVTGALKGFEGDFFDSYDISAIAVIHDMEKNIRVSDVVYEDMQGCFKEINKLLKKHSKYQVNDKTFYTEDNLFVVGEELAKSFIHKELPDLLNRYSIYGAEKLRTYKIRTVTPKLNLTLSSGIDYLEGDATLEIEGQPISLFSALAQYKKKSYIALNDGSSAIVNRNYLNKLERLFKKSEDKVKVSFFDLPFVEELINEKTTNDFFNKSKEVFSGFNNLKGTKGKYPVVNAKLRNYQKLGYKWINYLHKQKLGGCLADDMGLGKTLQAITLLSSIYPAKKKPSLIVMPRSLIFNWEAEVQKFNPKLTFSTYYGSDRDLKKARKSNLIFTTYAMVRNDIEIFKECGFYYIILDESQNIKNINAQITKAVMLLKSEHRLALSGTPIENNLGELYSLFRFLNPTMFGTSQEFNRNYVNPIQKDDDREMMNELKRKIYPFILRRMKKDVVKDLPAKVEQTLFVEMNSEQLNFYEQKRRYFFDSIRDQIKENGISKSQIYILQALSELRQIASVPEVKSDGRIKSAKREMLVENIADAVANGHKVLVFANFIGALETISENLNELGIDFLMMTGATRDRKGLVEKFQNGEKYRVFLMTLKTGGVGLNLTAADYIFIYDPWWNITAENQAVDRSHRIGQDKTVFSYKLITKNTIEEKILELQKMKSSLFDNLISTDGASVKSLSEGDIEFILGEGK